MHIDGAVHYADILRNQKNTVVGMIGHGPLWLWPETRYAGVGNVWLIKVIKMCGSQLWSIENI